MDSIDQDWSQGGEQLDDFLFDDSYLDNYFNSNGEALTESQQDTTLDSFDFGVQDDDQRPTFNNVTDGSSFSSPSSRNSQGRQQPPKTKDQFSGISPPSTMPPLDTRFRMDLQSASATNGGNLLPGANHRNFQGSAAQFHSTNYNHVPTAQNQNTNDQPLAGGLNIDAPTKVRKTRKRKAVSAEEKEKKKRAFLARNREAAKKCRAKRKVQQEGVQEKSLRLGRYNAQCKAELLDLQAMKTALMMELLPYQEIPGVMDELKSIQAGKPKRPAMFSFHDVLGLVPISETTPGSTTETISRRGSTGSTFSEQSTQTVIRSNAMVRSDSSSSDLTQRNLSRQETEFYRAIDSSSRDNSNISEVSQDKFLPRRIDTNFVPHDSQGLTPSTERCSSQNSSRDSGIGNVTPTTPQAHFSDEGIVVASPIPSKKIDPALLDDSMDFFTNHRDPEQTYNFLTPMEYLVGQNLSREVPWVQN